MLQYCHSALEKFLTESTVNDLNLIAFLRIPQFMLIVRIKKTKTATWQMGSFVIFGLNQFPLSYEKKFVVTMSVLNKLFILIKNTAEYRKG